MTKDIDPKLASLYNGPRDNNVLRQRFDEWASTYDADLLGKMGYRAHQEAAHHLMALIPDRQAKLLDLGCGTGLVGALLYQQGYRHLFGSDYSLPMLQEAARLGVYRELAHHDMTQPLEATAAYDGAVSVGVLAFGPVTAFHFKGLLNGLKPGAPLLATINGKGWREYPWEQELAQASARDGFVVEDVRTINYLVNEGIDGRLLTIRAR